MTTLSRSAIEPDVITLQCDVCFPQFIATTTTAALRERGWLMTGDGAEIDMCPHCRYEPHQGREPRTAEARLAAARQGGLPNLFIIGAAKAGTTSLHNYLAQHPDVFMADLKELRYFCDPDCADWLALYREQFPTSAPIRGESSTMYTRAPVIPGVPERMAALAPEARLIYLVRDPVERALASFREERFHLTDVRDPSAAFARPDDPHNPYVAASKYALQLDAFHEHFAQDQILVIDQRDLAVDPDGTLRRVQAFLGVPEHALDATTRHNTGDAKFEYGGLGDRLRHSAPARALRRTPAPVRRAITGPARRLLSREIDQPELPDHQLRQMRAALAPDAARFRTMTGLSLDHWSL